MKTLKKFSAYSLNTYDTGYKEEEILLYGLTDDSRYISIDFADAADSDDLYNGVYISSAYADKYSLKKGDTIKLKETYEDDTYQFTVDGIYNYEGGLTIFMPQKQLNDTFDLGSDYFSGYLSKTEITDIDQKYISSVIDLDSLSKISRQLTVSMGSMMSLVDGFCDSDVCYLDLSAFQDHYRQKCTGDFHDQNSRIYQLGDQSALHSLYLHCCRTVSFDQPSD